MTDGVLPRTDCSELHCCTVSAPHGQLLPALTLPFSLPCTRHDVLYSLVARVQVLLRDVLLRQRPGGTFFVCSVCVSSTSSEKITVEYDDIAASLAYGRLPKLAEKQIKI